MSGLFALLDDVAAIAKVAAASVDDIGAAAGKAGAKAAGVVIDDAAVTPKFVEGFHAARELPIIWRIALGSMRNKVLFLLPALLLLDWLLPVAIVPLLMLGGAYLCFEGAEKVLHTLRPPHAGAEQAAGGDDPAALEEARVAGAIRTDFILSAEIMTIAMSVVEEPSLGMTAAVLVMVALMVTAGVYGVVAVIVKMDDVGLHLARRARGAGGRAFGRLLVRGMPAVLATLSAVGTVAMLWVGGSIFLHGLAQTGLWPWPADAIHALAVAAAGLMPGVAGAAAWVVTAALDGVAGLALGLIVAAPFMMAAGRGGAH
ncbi:MAG: DUF808 domain-containing protein [Rubellimicrobium sp.]|nr:DUF808 domain-containing protein [Rubellimicrobium sp.]